MAGSLDVGGRYPVVETVAARMRYESSPTVTGEYGRAIDRLACAYVDSSVRDVRWIGSAYERLAGTGSISQIRGGLLLRTCERVEMYTASGEEECRSAHPFGEVALGLSGRGAVCCRLVEIVAGVSSRLLGDRFIAGQIERAGQVLPVMRPLRALAAEAVRFGRQVRVNHGFAAPADYPDLVEHLLRAAGRARPGSLVVVGGGVLARSVLGHRLVGGYRRVLPVTRSVKRLRKRLPDSRSDLRVCSSGSVWDELDGSGWDLVIATTNVSESYRMRISELLTDRRCRVAVDVSGVPVLDEPLDGRYHDLYGPAFSGLIAEQNSLVAGKAELVRAAIRSAHAEFSR